MKKRFCVYVILVAILSVLLTGCQPSVPAPSGSPNVQSTIDLAKKTNSSTERDSILLSGVSQAQSIEDIKALAVTCYSSTNRDQILLQGVKLAQNVEQFKTLAVSCYSSTNRDQILIQGISSAQNVDDVLTLARACDSSTNRDQLLLQGTKLANTNADYTKLAQTCYSTSNHDRILNRAAEGSINVNETPSDEVNRAFKEMQAAYTAYQRGMSDNLANSQLKVLAEEYKKKKATYDALIKK